MGTSAIADREAMLAAQAQIEVLTAQMNSLSIDAFTPLELLALMQRRETVTWMQPALDHKVYQRLTVESTPKQLGSTSFKRSWPPGCGSVTARPPDASRRPHFWVRGPR